MSCRLDIQGTPEEDGEGTLRCKLDASIDDIIQGKYSIVQCHPEALLETTTGDMLLDSAEFVSSVKALVIDECHKIQSW